jgi:HAD superfamily hydrolase (TIGR01509 family)
MLRALLWDVDGTLAETERDGHRVAFNEAFAQAGIAWRWSEAHYGELLAVAGGRERLLCDMGGRRDAPATDAERDTLARSLHRLKNAHYARIVSQGQLPLRPGVRELLEECVSAALPMGIVTTTSRSNLEALLRRHLGSDWERRFAVVVCAEQAPRKKPDPQAYLCALESLRIAPHETVTIEDAPAGITAAQRAGVPLVITRSYYFPATSAAGALAAGPALDSTAGWQPPADPHAMRIDLEQIMRWHARAPLPITP